MKHINAGRKKKLGWKKIPAVASIIFNREEKREHGDSVFFFMAFINILKLLYHSNVEFLLLIGQTVLIHGL